MMASAIRAEIRQWLLHRKLSRAPLANIAIELSRKALIRVYAAAACLVSMLLATWTGAFARALATDRWHTFLTLDGTSLLSASRHAGTYQSGMLPVLLVWAALLIVTPAGFTIAFRAAVAAAAVLGYVRFSPPSFAVSSTVASVSGWLRRFDDYCSRNVMLFLIGSIAVAYMFISNAAGVSSRLEARARRACVGGSASTVCAGLLALLVLLLAGWAATVIRLGGALPAAQQGSTYQAKYLLILVLIAVFVVQVSDSARWLMTAVLLTSAYALGPGAFVLPAVLRKSVGSGLFTHIGTAWGADALWAALFLYVPAIIFGIYLVARLRD